jgi:hypothetical protein
MAGNTKKAVSAAIIVPFVKRERQPRSPAPAPRRECGCAYGEACRCGPRLRIFDPVGRLLMMPVYY